MNNNTLPLDKPLIHLGTFLEDFIHTSNFPTSINCVETRKYLVLNQAQSTRENIPLKDYVGLTIHDLAKIMHYKPRIVDNALAVNHQIQVRALPHTQYKQIIPIHEGFICVEEVTKQPVYSSTKKVTGVLGYAREITPYVNLMYLFKLYQQYYPKKEAIRRFMQYMKLSEAFYELPSQRELEVLLTMKQSTAAKDVANLLCLTPKTIEENKARLRNRLRNITLGELVMKLRQYHELKEGIVQ